MGFEGRNMVSRCKVLLAVDRAYRPGEVVELEILGVVNRGELASDDGMEGDCHDTPPETLRTGCSWDDTFLVCGERSVVDDVDPPATTQVDNRIPEKEDDTQDA